MRLRPASVLFAAAATAALAIPVTVALVVERPEHESRILTLPERPLTIAPCTSPPYCSPLSVYPRPGITPASEERCGRPPHTKAERAALLLRTTHIRRNVGFSRDWFASARNAALFGRLTAVDPATSAFRASARRTPSSRFGRAAARLPSCGWPRRARAGPVGRSPSARSRCRSIRRRRTPSRRPGARLPRRDPADVRRRDAVREHGEPANVRARRRPRVGDDLDARRPYDLTMRRRRSSDRSSSPRRRRLQARTRRPRPGTSGSRCGSTSGCAISRRRPSRCRRLRGRAHRPLVARSNPLPSRST